MQHSAHHTANPPVTKLENPARGVSFNWYVAGAGIFAGAMLQTVQASLWPIEIYASIFIGALIGVSLVWGFSRREISRQHSCSHDAIRTALCTVLMHVLTLIGGMGLMFAWASIAASQHASGRLMPQWEGQDVRVQGVVAAMPRIQADGVRVRLKVEQFLTEHDAHEEVQGQSGHLGPSLLDIAWLIPRRYGENLQEETPPIPALQVGQEWALTVRLRQPHGAFNPLGFDYERWLWEQGVQAVGYVRQSASAAPPELLGEKHFGSPSLMLERGRQKVRDGISAYLASVSWGLEPQNRQAWERARGVIVALVTGEQREISQQDWDTFRITGVAHLMAISGMHITMFAFVAMWGLGWGWRKSVRLMALVPAPQASIVGGFLMALAYALFSGWGVPAQRTSLMLACWVVLRLLGVRWPWHASLLLAAVLVVVWQPLALLQPGFWLSFIAVAVLFGVVAAIEEKKRSHRAPLQKAVDEFDAPSKRAHSLPDSDQVCWAGQSWMSVATSAALLRLVVRVLLFFYASFRALCKRLYNSTRALWGLQWRISLVLAPLTVLFFGQISIIGLLANLFAIPLVTFVVTPLAMLGVLYAPAWAAAAWVTMWLIQLLEWLASWPLSMLQVPVVPIGIAVAAVLGAIALAAKLPLLARLHGLVWLALAAMWQPMRPSYGAFELLAADVGQGSAVIVQTNNHVLLYDAGPVFTQHTDAGKSVLVPLLQAHGLVLDDLVLSHSDTDHTGGAESVLRAYPQSQVWVTFPFESVFEQAQVKLCEAGRRWEWDGVQFEFLHPSQPMLKAHADALVHPMGQANSKRIWPTPNAMSCVLQIQAQNGSKALLTGDIGVLQELDLRLQYATKLQSDYLLVPHHGSRSSSSEAFLQAVSPSVAVAQAGYRNLFGHPTGDVVARYHAQSIQFVASAQCGAAIWRSTLPNEVQCQRDIHQRYWHTR